MMNIQQLLSSPEGKILEFKRNLSSPKPILKTLVAFANTAGGTLIIGRADDGAIVGVENVLADEERLANLIADSIAPAMMPDIESVTVDDKVLLLVRVAHWAGPFYLKEKGAANGVYVRLGSPNRLADEATKQDLERIHSHSSFDQLPCSGTSPDDLDLLAIRRWFAGKDHSVDAAAQESLGLLVRHGSGRVPSNGGLILFGDAQVRQRCFPDARVSCARFLGSDKTEFLDRQDVPSLLEAVEDVPRFIARNSRLASKIEGMQRRDIAEYPAIAIREVLINALAHADYSRTGMRIMISIFSDRLEIQSQGTLPFGMTLDDFKAGVSHVRNIVVSRVLHELGLMEQWGSGYQRVTNACIEGGYPEPEWIELGSCMRVTFRPHPELAPSDTVNDTVNDTVPDSLSDTVSRLGLNERQLWFVKQLQAGRAINAEDIVAQWSIGIATARRDVASLKKHDLIEFIGAAKTGRYQLKEGGQ